MDSRMHGLRRWTSTSGLLVALLLGACGGGDEPADGRDGGPDATVDGASDGSATDDGSTTDGAADASMDAPNDGAADASVDAPNDGGVDAATDAAPPDADVGTPCTEDADCDDGDECNGLEVCAEGRCAAGTPLECDDGDVCTADSCIPGSGCINVLIDADGDGQAPSTLGECGTDCDDTRSSVYEGAIEACDGLDNDCDGMTDEGTLITWYADCDGDGFAAADATRVEYCSLPPIAMAGCVGGGGTWTTRAPEEGSTDCNDVNPGVYPGREGWFDAPIPGVPADVDFDYDCSGSEERRYGRRGACFRRFRGCAVVTGFLEEVPACGESAMVVTACAWNGTDCVPSETEPLTQVCR